MQWPSPILEEILLQDSISLPKVQIKRCLLLTTLHQIVLSPVQNNLSIKFSRDPAPFFISLQTNTIIGYFLKVKLATIISQLSQLATCTHWPETTEYTVTKVVLILTRPMTVYWYQLPSFCSTQIRCRSK